jgi:hypothetical protein
MEPDLGQTLPLLLPALVLALVVRRSLRERKLKAERLWVMPVLLLLVAGSSLYSTPPTTPWAIGAVLVAVALGAVAGWWRGRLTHITIDPATHDLTSRTSPLGVLLVGGLYILRYGLRYYGLQHPSVLPGGSVAIADALMALAIVMVAVQRLEMWLRCQRLIADAVRAKAS